MGSQPCESAGGVIQLKVLFVLDGLAPGGAERSLAEMLPDLTRAGIEPTVAFFHRHEANLESLYRARGAVLHFVDARSLKGRVAALRRVIRMERPNVVHTALFNADLIGRLAAVGQKVVVVSSLVNTPYDRIRLRNSDVNALKFHAVRLVDGLTARSLTTHFHAVSETVKRAAVATMGLRPERITVIERGRNICLPGPERRRWARAKLGLHHSDKVILTVGRQEYQKGQRYLLEAIEEVIRRDPTAILLVAGASGRQSDTLIDIRRHSAHPDRIRLLGYREDVPDVLASADLFAFPSLYEGAAGALLEAMALGLPIVASRIPSIEEIVEEGHNALLVERATVEPLAAAITQLLSDRERATAFGLRSRKIFEERFTLDRCTRRMVAFYRQLARRQDPHRLGQAASELPC
jgi:glycosyltransferase involved in cell wall biosynthesis